MQGAPEDPPAAKGKAAATVSRKEQPLIVKILQILAPLVVILAALVLKVYQDRLRQAADMEDMSLFTDPIEEQPVTGDFAPEVGEQHNM